jgi:hypothetical protein
MILGAGKVRIGKRRREELAARRVVSALCLWPEMFNLSMRVRKSEGGQRVEKARRPPSLAKMHRVRDTGKVRGSNKMYPELGMTYCSIGQL